MKNRCYVADAEQLQKSKEENIRVMKWRLADRRTGGRAKQIKARKRTKHGDASKNGAEFHLREQGIGDECG